jgi:hypothetical protein
MLRIALQAGKKVAPDEDGGAKAAFFAKVATAKPTQLFYAHHLLFAYPLHMVQIEMRNAFGFCILPARWTRSETNFERFER